MNVKLQGTVYDPNTFKSVVFQYEPDKCPVCEGRGTVPIGFYDSDADRIAATLMIYNELPKCRSCEGTGLING